MLTTCKVQVMTFDIALPFLLETLSDGYSPGLGAYIEKISSFNNIELLNVVARFLEALGSTDDPVERVMCCCNIFYATQLLSERKVGCELVLTNSDSDVETEKPETLASLKG